MTKALHQRWIKVRTKAMKVFLSLLVNLTYFFLLAELTHSEYPGIKMHILNKDWKVPGCLPIYQRVHEAHYNRVQGTIQVPSGIQGPWWGTGGKAPRSFLKISSHSPKPLQTPTPHKHFLFRFTLMSRMVLGVGKKSEISLKTEDFDPWYPNNNWDFVFWTNKNPL